MRADFRGLAASEPFRFVLAGIWNSFFGWGAFSLAWLLLRDVTNLWVISAIAHLVSTTQTFLVQRHLVFRRTAEPVGIQYLKFQLSYFVLLGVGALVVNALSAQTVHPMLAQLIAMALLAVCGFLLGKSFTFNPNVFEISAPAHRLRKWLFAHRMAMASFIGAMLLFEYCWGNRFYGASTLVGHDFALTGIGLLEGKYWIDINGLIAGLFNPPWFTPAWCAGTAFYADPQSVFYSPLQMLALWVDPFQATHLNALLFACIAFWGSYGLARMVLGWTESAATVFALLGVANNFLPLRSAVGEAGYQPLYLWTLLALSLAWPSTTGRLKIGLWPSVGVALCLTAWLQFGFAGMMVPAFLGTVAFCLVLALLRRSHLLDIVGRSAFGGILALVLNGSKLYESASLMHNFPRDFYSMPGFPSLRDALTSVGMSLLAPSEWTAFFGLRRMMGMNFAVLPHEWALSFGLGALVMALMFGGVLLWLRRTSQSTTPLRMGLASSERLSLFLLLLIFMIPPLLLWNQGGLREAIKQIPILNSAAWPMRWIVIYLPAVQLLLAMPVHEVTRRMPLAWSPGWLGAAFMLIWLGPLSEPVDYYRDRNIQNYATQPVVQAFQRSREGRPTPIDRISASPDQIGGARNDTMLEGASQGYCYNPIYGYRLESFPQMARLKSGPALEPDASGQSLLFNPACLVHPSANACSPGSGFRMDDPVDVRRAQNFISRHPYDWKRPRAGMLLAWVSQICFWVLLTLLALRVWQGVLQLFRPIKIDLEHSGR